MPRYKVKRILRKEISWTSCIACKKPFSTNKGFLSHFYQMHIRTAEQRTKDYSMRGCSKGRRAWNKGLTKDNSSGVRSSSEKNSILMKEAFSSGKRIPPKQTLETLRKLSERQSLHNSGGRCKWFSVNGVKVQGTWERDIAVILTSLEIAWIKPSVNRDILKYVLDGKEKSYTPDFYLPKYDVYLEVKGHWWGRDREKMDAVLLQHKDKKFLLIQKEEYLRITKGEQVWLLREIENLQK